MADDRDDELKAILADVDVPDSARESMGQAGRRATADEGFRYQTLSDGQWYNSPSLRPNVVDDFTGEIISEGKHKLGEPTGRVPLAHELDAMVSAARVAKAVAPLTEQAKAKAAFDPYLRQKFPDRYNLRRNIDMTVRYDPKPRNDRDYQAAKGKVAPAKVKPKATDGKVPPRMRPKPPADDDTDAGE